MSIKWKAAIAGAVVGALALAGVRRQLERILVRRLRRDQPGRLLDPRAGQQAGHRRLEQDRRRQGRRLQAVVRRVRRPEPRGDRRPEGRHRPPVARARRAEARRRQARRRRLERRPRPRASSPSPSWSSWSARATPRTSRAGTTWSSRASRSSPRTRPRPARRSGTSSPPTATCWPTAAPRPRPQAYLTKFFGNVVALPGSGRDATTAFQRRHRRRAALLRERGDPGPAERRGLRLHRPAETLLIENPGAVTTDATPKAKKFLDLPAPARQAQTDYAEEGFRPLVDGVKVDVKGANDPSDPFPTPPRSC